MKICVYGLWHLGSVTSACLARAGIEVVGLDDETVVAGLGMGKAPIFEPGLEDRLRRGLAANGLAFTSHVPEALAGAGVVWVCFDTPVDDDNSADVGFVVERVVSAFPHIGDGAVVMISSQLPVGSTRAIERRFASVARGRNVSFAYSPENLRVGAAIEAFDNPGRIVVGVREERARRVVEPVLSRLCEDLIWVGVESAEMAKHALNAFLASNVTLTNEVAAICERVGADAGDVERALRSDPRVGRNAYVRAGAAIAGGTLARDVAFLYEIARAEGVSAPLLESIPASNDEHRTWPVRQLEAELGGLEGRKIAILGLTYKPGTDSLRDSPALGLARGLAARNARVSAFDPQVRSLPDAALSAVDLARSVDAALDRADAVVVATEWPEFKELTTDRVARAMTGSVVVDAGGFLGGRFEADSRLHYIVFGKGG